MTHSFKKFHDFEKKLSAKTPVDWKHNIAIFEAMYQQAGHGGIHRPEREGSAVKLAAHGPTIEMSVVRHKDQY